MSMSVSMLEIISTQVVKTQVRYGKGPVLKIEQNL